MDPSVIREQLVMAQQRAAEGRHHIARQEALVASLDELGHDTTNARKVLATLRDTQILHEQDVERLLRELRKDCS